jgi:3-methyladenine DNA glycosylase Mpg
VIQSRRRQDSDQQNNSGKNDNSHSVKVLDATFFDRPAEKVAHDLIGHRLNWMRRDTIDSHIIIETEAYIGPEDLASHAAKGRTKRNEAMFGPPGIFYVYFVYGLHWMLNVVTGPVGYPAHALLRSVEGILGPARLTKALTISGELNGMLAFLISPHVSFVGSCIDQFPFSGHRFLLWLTIRFLIPLSVPQFVLMLRPL